MTDSHPMPTFRPLLPWPPPKGEGNQDQNVPSRRSVVAAACNQCRRGKAKCDAGRPKCRRCARLGNECEYDTSGTETRSGALKRKFTELDKKSSLQDELIKILRTREAADVAAVVHRLRTGDEIEAIVKLVRDGDLLLQCSLKPETSFRYEFPLVSTMPHFLFSSRNPYLDSLLYHRVLENPSDTTADYERAYDIPFHAAKLFEPRLEKVKASKWTPVTSSDELVRTLLEVYFQYEYPTNCFFHIDHFLDDLAAGRDEYCSRLLVNIILAIACHGHRAFIDRTTFWDPQTLGYRFLAEAKRIWELERNGKPKITTIQAGALICINSNMDGIDVIGLEYLRQAIAMAQKFGLFSERFEDCDAKQRVSYSLTAWSLYAWQAVQLFHYYQEPLLSESPVIPLSGDMGEVWVKYPHARDPWPINQSPVFYALVRFRAIINEIGLRNFGRDKAKGPITLDEALAYRQKLLDWQQSLPPPLTTYLAVLPAPLKLHMHFHNMMICLFEPLVSGESPETLSDSEGDADILTPSDIVTHSKICMESVIRLYYLRHGFDIWDTLIIVYLQFVGFNTLRDLAISDAKSYNSMLSTILLCAKGLREQTRFQYIAEAVFTFLRDRIKPEVSHLLKDLPEIEYEEERREIVQREVKSSYPINMASITDDPDNKRLDNMIQSLKEASIYGSTGSESESPPKD
ncbi:Nitrogen assimilation transcription factor nit-4-like protein [Cladobotryum mycophilum]|uniref:Nitrogen assimilation transcription factor nit-4-like protein n=1 Tax=Cladobotryum mycophilum TaxID=491253 RepID=A0ABR0SZA1_9HYPO